MLGETHDSVAEIDLAIVVCCLPVAWTSAQHAWASTRALTIRLMPCQGGRQQNRGAVSATTNQPPEPIENGTSVFSAAVPTELDSVNCGYHAHIRRATAPEVNKASIDVVATHQELPWSLCD